MDSKMVYSYKDNQVLISEEKLIITNKMKKEEFSLSSIYGIFLMKNKISIRYVYFSIVFGLIGIVLLVNGALHILTGGVGETIVGIIFTLISLFSVYHGVLPKYSLNIGTSSAGNRSFRVKQSPELNRFINDARTIIKNT
ncbi:MAG: hypothetical protein QXU18_09545 [Thermoplasmatales archaeon]